VEPARLDPFWCTLHRAEEQPLCRKIVQSNRRRGVKLLLALRCARVKRVRAGTLRARRTARYSECHQDYVENFIASTPLPICATTAKASAGLLAGCFAGERVTGAAEQHDGMGCVCASRAEPPAVEPQALVQV